MQNLKQLFNDSHSVYLRFTDRSLLFALFYAEWLTFERARRVSSWNDAWFSPNQYHTYAAECIGKFFLLTYIFQYPGLC